MTSRLTLSALIFSLLSTATLVSMAEARTTHTDVTSMRVVQLQRVVITAPRLMAKA